MSFGVGFPRNSKEFVNKLSHNLTPFRQHFLDRGSQKLLIEEDQDSNLLGRLRPTDPTDGSDRPTDAEFQDDYDYSECNRIQRKDDLIGCVIM